MLATKEEIFEKIKSFKSDDSDIESSEIFALIKVVYGKITQSMLETFTLDDLKTFIESCIDEDQIYRYKLFNKLINVSTFEKFSAGEAVIYQNGNKFELGIVKTVCGNDEYFINYHTGDTAAKTSARNLHKITNGYAFHVIRLDPDDNERR